MSKIMNGERFKGAVSTMGQRVADHVGIGVEDLPPVKMEKVTSGDAVTLRATVSASNETFRLSVSETLEVTDTDSGSRIGL